MGHRANYAILEGGKLSLFYSHWGALTVPEDMFWGPEHAESFIREQDEIKNDDWLDDVWGEGGVAFNKDDQQITLFGGESLGFPPLVTSFVELMSAWWGTHGWTVSWADAGMPAIAAAVGVDPTVATAEPLPPIAADLAEVGTAIVDEASGDFGFSCLITTIEHGEFTHVIADYVATSLLANGEEVLPILSGLPEAETFYPKWTKPDYFDDEPWSMGDEFSSSIILNLDAHSVAFREPFANVSALGFLSLHWPKWEFVRFDGDLEDHFERLGIPTPKPLIPLNHTPTTSELVLDNDEAMEQIAGHLLNSEREDPSEMVRQLMEEHEEEGEEIWVNPHALKNTSFVVLEEKIRGEIFGRALAAMVEDETRLRGV